MTMTIRAMSLADLATADAIAVAAYQTPTSRATEIRRYLGLQPDGWLLALEDEVPVGMGGVVDYGAFGYIGLIGVLPTMQRRGIASAIMAHILRWLADRGTPCALLDASQAGTPLYEQLGFVVDDQSEVWQLGNAPPTIPYQARVVNVPVDAIDTLIRYDQRYFHADRGKVLQALIHEFPQRVLAAYDEAGDIAGYLVAQSRMLGPWIANAPMYAEALLRHALTLPFAAAPTVLVPAAHRDASVLMQRTGFVRQRTLQHMRRGGTAPRSRLGTYGLASFSLG